MQRKPNFPVANCAIKMPESMHHSEVPLVEEEAEQLHRRQQLINFGHAQWGFSNWSWSVTKQELDFVDISNGKFTAGVVAFVSITVKTLDIHRENIGYATSHAPFKGAAIHRARKCAVTNALRETLLSFGGNIATELTDILDLHKTEIHNSELPENNQNLQNIPKHSEPKNSPLKNIRKESSETNSSVNIRPHGPPVIKNAAVPPPVAKALPIPANLPPAANKAPPAAPPIPPPNIRPNSNEAPTKPLEAMNEEVRAERKRRQKQAQEEFRLMQLMKKAENEKHELRAITMEPSQDIVIEDSGSPAAVEGKREAASEGNVTRKRAMPRLDIVH